MSILSNPVILFRFLFRALPRGDKLLLGRVKESTTDDFRHGLLIAQGAASFDGRADIVQRIGIVVDRIQPLRGQITRVEEIGRSDL